MHYACYICSLRWIATSKLWYTCLLRLSSQNALLVNSWVSQLKIAHDIHITYAISLETGGFLLPQAPPVILHPLGSTWNHSRCKFSQAFSISFPQILLILMWSISSKQSWKVLVEERDRESKKDRKCNFWDRKCLPCNFWAMLWVLEMRLICWHNFRNNRSTKA